jgi:hypothetical protein
MICFALPSPPLYTNKTCYQKNTHTNPKGKAHVKPKHNKITINEDARDCVVVCYFHHCSEMHLISQSTLQNHPDIINLNTHIDELWQQLLNCIIPKCKYVQKMQNLKLMLEQPDKFTVTDKELAEQVTTFLSSCHIVSASGSLNAEHNRSTQNWSPFLHPWSCRHTNSHE